jgi:hypothetical protein
LKESENKNGGRFNFDELISKLDKLYSLVNLCYEKVQNDIFSEEINKIFSEIELELKSLPPIVSGFIELLNSGKIPFDKLNVVSVKFADVESIFQKLISFLKNLSEADSRRIQYFLNLEAQIKSASSVKSKGKVVEKKF